MESRQVLARLAEQGIHIHRETLARMSDELGLETRSGTGRTVPRHWSLGQTRVLVAHLQATDNDARGARPLRQLTEADGPFPSREVLAHLRKHGFDIHRGRLASISDKLGLQTRVGANSRIPREWTHDQVGAVLTFLCNQRLQQERRREDRLREEQERLDRQERLEQERLERQERQEQERLERLEQERLERQERQERQERERQEAKEQRQRRQWQQRRGRKLTALAKDLLVDAALDLEAPQLQALLAGDPDLTDRFLNQVTALLQELVSTDNLTEQPNHEGRDTTTEAA